MYFKFIKLILPLPSFFEIALPSDEEPNVFPVIVTRQKIACPICAGATVCHDRSIADVAREYELPYTTVERWFYTYAPHQLMEESAKHICGDEFALRKGHHYATSVLNAETVRILGIVPHRDQDAIETVLKKVTGKIQTVISDFAPAMAGAIQAVFPATVHVLDRFHLVFHRCPTTKTPLFRRSEKAS